MDMNEFLRTYNENQLNALREHLQSIHNLNIDCDFCPLQKACQRDSEENGEGSCADFIQRSLEDGQNFLN